MKEHDEGFARNIQKLFGAGNTFEGMGDSPIRSVTLSEDKERITFEFENDFKALFGVEGDCCSHSWIEHLEVPDYVIGQKLISVEDQRMEQKEDEYGDLLQVYNTRFRTDKGDIVLEYRNESNGYYGGYLIRINEDGTRRW